MIWNWRPIRLLFVSGSFLGLTSCVQVVMSPTDITPAMANDRTARDPFFNAICVSPDNDFTQKSGSFIYKVPSMTMTMALTNALTNNNLYALDGHCNYTLTATVDHIGSDFMVSMPFSPRPMNSTLSYRLTDTRNGIVVINKTLTTQYSQNWIYTFPADQGAEDTMVEGAKGAVRSNIGAFMGSIP